MTELMLIEKESLRFLMICRDIVEHTFSSFPELDTLPWFEAKKIYEKIAPCESPYLGFFVLQQYKKYPAIKMKIKETNPRKFFKRNNHLDLLKNGCAICGFKDMVDLHHINGLSDNEHIIALCPSHHMLIHRKHISIDKMREDHEVSRIRQG